MTALSAGKDDDTVMPRGEASGHRWRALAARLRERAGGGGSTARPPAMLGNALFALFLGGILVYGAAFAWYMLGRFDLVSLVDANADDAFYYFQIAWHMARGEFSTFDGGITRTNGYHPLWLLLITPVYWMFDKETALYAIKAFEIVLVAGGVALVAAAAWLARLPWILLFAALPALYRQEGMLLGLEAAAALFMLGLFFFTIVLFARDSVRWRWPLAAAAFALPWVRLEYAAISLAATAALLLIEWTWRDRPRPGARARSISALGAGGPFLAAGAGLVVYFGYNGVVFGGLVPVSAAIKRVWSQYLWEGEDGYDLTRNFHDFLQVHAFDDELWLVFEIFVYVLLVWWFASRSRSREDRLLLAFLVGVFGLAAGHLAKFVQSVLTIHPDLGKYHWYFVPAYLMEAIMIPARCCVAIWFIRRFIGPRLHLASGILILGVVGSGAAFLYTTTIFTDPFRFVDRKTTPAAHEWNIAALTGLMVTDRVLPEGSVVGSWDSGVIGYFSRFPVVNLDGLANSFDYFHSARNQLLAGEDEALDVFMQRFGITHFANVVFPSGHHDTMLFRGVPCCIDAGTNRTRQFELRLAAPQDAPSGGAGGPGRLWERLEPHLMRQTNDIALLVNGRMMLAFTRECDPEYEMLAWIWGRQDDEAIYQPWTRTGTGSCVSAMVIPQAASDGRPG